MENKNEIIQDFKDIKLVADTAIKVLKNNNLRALVDTSIDQIEKLLEKIKEEVNR